MSQNKREQINALRTLTGVVKNMKLKMELGQTMARKSKIT